MDQEGTWRLAPAFDVTYSYKPGSIWASKHQMTIRGKRERIQKDDLIALGRDVGIKKPAGILDRMVEVVADWESFAAAAKVEREKMRAIGDAHHLDS